MSGVGERADPSCQLYTTLNVEGGKCYYQNMYAQFKNVYKFHHILTHAIEL